VPLEEPGRAGDLREPLEVFGCSPPGEMAGLELLRPKRRMSKNIRGEGRNGRRGSRQVSRMQAPKKVVEESSTEQ